MSFLWGFIWAIEKLLFVYFSFTTLYNFVLSFASLFRQKKINFKGRPSSKFAILIPAYREDEVIINTIENLLKQNYSRDLFEIIVVADSFQSDTLKALERFPVKVIRVEFEMSTKVRSLNAAFNVLNEKYDAAVILDADNVLAPDFLEIVNNFIQSGHNSVQGMRIPKNSDTIIAYLDGLSEAINNNIIRKGTCNLGGSSAIVGSGFTVKYEILKEVLSTMDSVSGFDKELEIKLLERGVKTLYSEDLIIYDEKVDNPNDFKSQRQRWIFSQFFYLRKYLNLSVKSLLKGNFALFNSAFLRYAQLPRFMNFVILFLVCLAFTFWDAANPEVIFWWSLFFCSLLSVLLAVPRNFYTKKMIIAFMELPKVFIIMTGLLFKLKGTNRKFLHTPHRKTKVDL